MHTEMIFILCNKWKFTFMLVRCTRSASGHTGKHASDSFAFRMFCKQMWNTVDTWNNNIKCYMLTNMFILIQMIFKRWIFLVVLLRLFYEIEKHINVIYSFLFVHDTFCVHALKSHNKYKGTFVLPQWKKEMKLFIQSTENWSAEVVNCSWNKWRTLDFSNAFLVLLLCAILAVVFVAFVAKMQLPPLSKRNYSNRVEAKPN